MSLEKPINPNYCATLVEIEKLVELENCDNVVAAIIFGNSVIVGKDTKVGDLGLFFPAETQLSHDFVGENNLYRKAELNRDVTKKGYFEENRRIKTMKFRGHKSEGLFMPIACLNYIMIDITRAKELEPYIVKGVDFDKILGHEICCKYVIRVKESGTQKQKDKKKVNKFDRLVENQFRLHIDTENLRRNAHKLNPEDMISITNKIHGTSWVVGKVLTKEPLPWWKSIFTKFVPTAFNNTKYDVIYSSRTVVKNKYINTTVNSGFYNFDLWGVIADYLKSSIQDGITLYGEAVGQLPTGAWIQKGYHYGTRPNEHEVYVYRITSTNAAGQVIEFSWPQIKEYCNKYGIKHVTEFYYGKAKDYCPDIPLEQHWNQNFLAKLEADYMRDRKCPLNSGDVWEEGIVVRVDGLFECPAYKLKNFAFLDKETKDLDKGLVDLESEQSLADEEEVDTDHETV
jgi:hypothetical protein